MSISSEQCRAARALLDWSQQELASRAKVARKTIADFELGQVKPYTRTLRDVVAVLERRAVIRPGAIALVSAELAAIVHVQFTPAMTAAQKPGQRQFAFAGRPASERAGHASRINSDCLEIALEFFPADVKPRAGP